MEKTVVIDAFGGDNAPHEIIKGVLLALDSRTDFSVVLCGKQDVIKQLIGNADMQRISIVDAPDVITNDESPTEAIRNKKQSSLVKALDELKHNENAIGLVSAGSTGAVLTGGYLKIGRIRGISRPALAPTIPTVIEGKNVLLLDCGANVDCKPVMLAHFAVMGHAYAKAVFKIDSPKVALLSNGTEDKKGNELTKAAFKLLSELPINFVGNMEAREIISGDYDVIVADGFDGNVALKSTEGATKGLLKILKTEIMSTMAGKIGGMFLKSTFNRLKTRLDYSNMGGAPFIGINKLIIKSHGSSQAESIKASVFQVLDMHNDGLVQKISDVLQQVEQSGVLNIQSE